MTFLQVVTRTFGRRPAALARNRASLMALQDHDWIQTFVVDNAGRGVAWANANLATVPAGGEYVWVLDDDDVCVLPGLVGELKALAVWHDPAVIVARVSHAQYGVLPHAIHWGAGCAPAWGDCGWSNYFVRADVWERRRGYLAKCGVYEGDYRFAAHLWDTERSMPKGVWSWLDVIAAYYPQVSDGAGEAA